MARAVPDVSFLFIELGCAIVGLALLARLANRWGFSAIPLYLLAGLAFGDGGVAPLDLSENFIHIGAEIGVLLLLFMLALAKRLPQQERITRQGRWDLQAKVMANEIQHRTLGTSATSQPSSA